MDNQYAFFDMDGTLINTDYANFLAYQKAISEAVGFSAAKVKFDCKHRFDRAFLRELLPSLRTEELGLIVDLKSEFYNEFLSETSVEPSVVEKFKELFDTHKLVLVTRSHFKRAQLILEFHGLHGYLEKIFSVESLVCNNKYASALSLMGLPSSEALVFENETYERNCALNAGISINNIFMV